MKHAFPTHHWEHDKFVKHTGTIVGIEVSLEAYLFLLGRNAVKTPQSLMKRIVQTIFPSGKIEVNVRSAHGIIGDSGAPLEIDVYLPEYRLGFEYQVSQATSFFRLLIELRIRTTIFNRATVHTLWRNTRKEIKGSRLWQLRRELQLLMSRSGGIGKSTGL